MNTIFTTLPDIFSMGDKIFEPHWSLHNHRANTCELLLVMEGWLRTVFYRRCSFTTMPGGFVLIPGGIRHRDEFDPELGMKVFMVSFRWQHDRDYFRRVPIDACRNVPTDVRRTVVKQCDKLRDCLESGTDADLLLARAHLLTILLTVLRSFETWKGPRVPPAGDNRNQSHALMLQARAYLDAHYAEEISLEKIAKHLRVSPFYLSHIFSKESNFSLMEYLVNRRMQHAKKLLQSGTHSIKEVAHAGGYNDGNYFSKVFNRHFGIPPRDWLQRTRR